MNQRVMVSVSAVALVAVVAGGAALAVRNGSSSHTPKTIMIQGGDASASETRMAADTPAALAPNALMNFVLSGDLPALDGSRPAWHLAANPSADPDAIAALAKALGVDGDVKTVDGGWQVGQIETGHGLFVNKAPGLPWNYSNSNMGVYTCAAGGSAPPDGGSSTTPAPPVCAEPPAPTGVPTKDEALAKAVELFKVLGIDASTYAITANVSDWSADVQALPSLDGVPAPSLSLSFGFAGEGKLQYANGYLLAPEKADTYPLIGTTQAFDLLKTGKGFGGWFAYGGSISAVATTAEPATTNAIPADDATSFETVIGTNCMAYDPATGLAPPPGPICMCMTVAAPADTPSTTVPCPPTPCYAEGSATPPATDQLSPFAMTCGPVPCSDAVVTTAPSAPLCVLPQPMPVEMTFPPEPVSITITGVHETLLPLSGADGSMWLVPGYEFTSADGGTWPVLAIDQSFVDQVAPNQPIPAIVTTETVLETPTVTAPPETPETFLVPTTSAPEG